MVIARGCKQQRFRVGTQQLAHPGQHDMANDFRARRAAGLAGHNGTQFCRAKTFGEQFDLRGFAGSLAALKGDESSAPGSSFDRCLGHGQSFSAPARNIPITSSLAPSIARRIVDPLPTGSAAKTGASLATVAPPRTLTKRTRWPGSIGAGTGPL